MPIHVTKTTLPAVKLIRHDVYGDARGFFMETYNARDFRDAGIDAEFVQDNLSSSRKGVVRGLHYQLGRPQAKLVRVLEGSVWDVAVDIRKGSETFGHWTAAELSGENKHSLFVPEGFAHGFCVLSDTAVFSYKCSDFYAPEEERGIAWNDPKINIPWPLDGAPPILSEKDRELPTLSQLPPADLPG